MAEKQAPPPAVPPAPEPAPPRIPEAWLSGPEQRLYAVALVGASQIYKATDVLYYLFQTNLASIPTPAPASRDLFSRLATALLPYHWTAPLWSSLGSQYLAKWLFWDVVLVGALMYLRIPGLRFGPWRGGIYVGLLVLVDTVLLGKVPVTQWITSILLGIGQFLINPFGKVTTLSDRSSRPRDVIDENKHLLGSLTLRLQPAGVAQFNPTGATFCFPPDKHDQPIFIPIVMNNSNPEAVEYELWRQDLQGNSQPYESHKIKYDQLRRLPSAALARRQSDLEFDDDEDMSEQRPDRAIEDAPDLGDAVKRKASIKPGDMLSALPRHLDSSQRIFFLPISKPGLVVLKKIEDDDGAELNLRRAPGVLVFECPSEATAAPSGSGKHLPWHKKETPPVKQCCVGSQDVVEMHIKGVGTLQAFWAIHHPNGTVEQLQINGIESGSAPSLPVNDPVTNPEQAVVLAKQLSNVLLPAAATSRPIFMPIFHSKPGLYHVVLHTVVDSYGNEYFPPKATSTRSFEVIAGAEVSFVDQCASAGTIELLEGGSAKLLARTRSSAPGKDLTASVSFSPASASAGQAWTHDIKFSDALQLTADQPGVYRLEDVKGPVCPGAVIEPATCAVRLVPRPQANVSMTAVPGCAGDVGLIATIEATGSPPFVVSYQRTRDGKDRQTGSKQFSEARYALELRPRQAGTYVYQFLSIRDAKYGPTKLDVPDFTQTVHPEAQVSLISPKRTEEIWTCARNTSQIELELSGKPNFVLDYNIAWPGGHERKQFESPSDGLVRIPVEVPASLSEQREGAGGIFTVEVFNVKDGNGCDKAVNEIATFSVKTTTPTVRFGTNAQVNGSELRIAEGSKAALPIRLTGEKPWDIKILHTNTAGVQSEKLLERRKNAANDFIEVESAGLYQLVSVKDTHCPGSVVTEHSSLRVTYFERPSLKTIAEGLRVVDKQLQRPGVCAGAVDQVPIHAEGQGQFEVLYKHSVSPAHSRSEQTRHVLPLAQGAGSLHMMTTPGTHTYELLAIGDSAYPLGDHQSYKKPLQTFKQKVFERPGASIRLGKRPSFCLHDKFTASSGQGNHVVFRGEPPFRLDIEIVEPGTTRRERRSIDGIKSLEWPIAMEDYEFGRSGTFIVHIAGIRDSSQCTAEVTEDDVKSLVIDVVEPAQIMAVDRREHYCVGDMLEFKLQGTAPWTINYFWNGKKQHTTAKSSTFSRLADKPGVFAITSVAHQQNQCLANVSDLKRTIHRIPSAKVREGGSAMEVIAEGAETSIIFTFEGEPPFAFTYVRSVPTGKKGAMKVEETKTITNIQEHTYKMYASSEGEYHVSYIADAWCSYPPAAAGAPSGAKLITNG